MIPFEVVLRGDAARAEIGFIIAVLTRIFAELAFLRCLVFLTAVFANRIALS